MSNEKWDKVMDLVSSDDHLWGKARECACAQLTQEQMDENEFFDIGSSDINCVVFDRLQNCSSFHEVVLEMVDWCNEVL